MRIWSWPAAMVMGACAALLGCGSDNPRQVAAGAFYGPPAAAVNEAPLSRTDRSGQLSPRDHGPTPPPITENKRPQEISPEITQLVRPPGQDNAIPAPEGTTRPSATTLPSTTTVSVPTTLPAVAATTEPAMSPGISMTLGGVVAVVNDKPIYANKVLRLDEAILRQFAREHDIQRFEVAVRQQIDKTVVELEYDELEYAAGERTLDASDKEFANRLARSWRDRQIREADGSIELVRRKFEADGKNFEDEVETQHRLFLRQLYYMRKFDPQVDISRGDMLRYYNDHLDSVFTRHETADIQILQADPVIFHGRDAAAIAMLKDERKHLLDGEEPADRVAFNQNLKYTPSSNVPRGSFALEHVDEAIWKLQPGGVSDVIEDGGGYYLVKVTSRSGGSVAPFASQVVQEKISSILKTEQLAKLREIDQRKLFEEAIVRQDQNMIDACVEMALQNYALWRKMK